MFLFGGETDTALGAFQNTDFNAPKSIGKQARDRVDELKSATLEQTEVLKEMRDELRNRPKPRDRNAHREP